jgi:hypothetical protein
LNGSAICATTAANVSGGSASAGLSVAIVTLPIHRATRPVEDVGGDLSLRVRRHEQKVRMVDAEVDAGPVRVGTHAQPYVLQVEVVVAQ